MCSLFVLIFSFHRAIIVFTLLSSLDSLKYGGPQVSRQNQIATTKQKATAKQKPRLNKKATGKIKKPRQNKKVTAKLKSHGK